jgi:hypothetical protein
MATEKSTHDTTSQLFDAFESKVRYAKAIADLIACHNVSMNLDDGTMYFAAMAIQDLLTGAEAHARELAKQKAAQTSEVAA